MAAHSSILTWRIPWTEEPGGSQSMGSVSKSWTGLTYFHSRLPGSPETARMMHVHCRGHGFDPWMASPTQEQTPGDREGQGSLVCCSPWGRKESDTPEQLNNSKNKGTNILRATKQGQKKKK